MTSIQIGPLSLPLLPLVFIAAWLLAQQAAAWMSPREQRARAAAAVSTAGLVGLLAARVAYVVVNLDVYRDTPMAVFDVRDGGWAAWAGVVAGLAWLLAAAVRRRAAPRVLAAATALGLGLWLGVGGWVQSRQATALPAVALQRLTAPQAEASALDAYRGRPFVVNLWATWCAPCREEMPAFAQVQVERPEVPIVFVNQGEGLAQVRAYLARLPQPLEHVLLDPGGTLSDALRAKGLPTTVFVDGQGLIRHIHPGVMNRAALRARIDALD